MLLAISFVSSLAFTNGQEPSKQGVVASTQATERKGQQSPPGMDGSRTPEVPAQPGEKKSADNSPKASSSESTLTSSSVPKPKEASAAGKSDPAISNETLPQIYVATAYSLRGRAANGKPVAQGMIAADPRLLPLGTRVRIEAGSFTGEYVVADTGGWVRGRHIDIWTPTSRQARTFGKRSVKLTVLSYGPRRAAAADKTPCRVCYW